MTRDGHFQLAADSDIAGSEPEEHSQEPAKEKRRIRALLTPRRTEPESDADLQPQGGWYRQPEKSSWRPAASSFVNRTEDWMTLSQVAAGSLASTRLQAPNNHPNGQVDADGKPQPQVPPERYKQKPKSWPATAWSEYSRAYESLKDVRAGSGNVIATGAAIFLGPDSCILKIMYVFFSMEGEDDYPYIPRGCGDFFDFALNANSIPVPWMLIGGILTLVTGTHSTAYSL